ncbi:MAG: polymer-forming cytoskeletal protein [Anaerolineales bacterium]
MKKLVLVPVVVLVAALALPGAAYAGEAEQGQVVFGDTFTLESGDVLDGDLVIFGGSAELEQGSRVNGDVLLFGGNAEINGEIDGDLALLGGNANLGPSAVIGGDVVTLGGNVDRAEGAVVEGHFRSVEGFNRTFSFDFPSLPDFDDTFRIRPFGRSSIGPFFSPATGILWFVLRTLVVAALAILVVLFWPKPAERAGRAAVSQPIVAGGLGCLTFMVVPILILLMAITIIGLPLSFLAVVALVVAVVFGWIAIGVEVGRRMVEAFNWEIHSAAAAGIGTLAVGFVIGGIGLVPCVGWLAPLLVGSAGLGAVILTRFGSREYQMASANAELPPPKSKKKAPAKKASSKQK